MYRMWAYVCVCACVRVCVEGEHICVYIDVFWMIPLFFIRMRQSKFRESEENE
jgi:hypothetical protein